MPWWEAGSELARPTVKVFPEVVHAHHARFGGDA
jgi:hypothetical protein